MKVLHTLILAMAVTGPVSAADWQALPETVVEAGHYLISPAFDGPRLERRTLDWCLRLVEENPPWRLSVQVHKLLGIR